MKASLKNDKRVRIAQSLIVGSLAGLVLTGGLLIANTTGAFDKEEPTRIIEGMVEEYEADTTLKSDNESTKVESVKTENVKPNRPLTNSEALANLNKVRSKTLPTYTDRFEGEMYEFAREEDVLEISKELSVAIQDYFKTCGASDWTNPDEQQFWPENIEYIVTAIAFRESTYRANLEVNELGCGGITGLNEAELLKTLKDEWLTQRIWGDTIPQVNCNADEVHTTSNAVEGIEYTYYNIGYNLANFYKKDKFFTDTDGQRRSVWQVLEYNKDAQIRLIIASHLFGVGNVIDATFGRQKDGHKIEEYLNSDYVNDVLDKTRELIYTYGAENTLGLQ